MGAEWNLWSNGVAKISVNLPVDGTFRATLWLRGRAAKGVPPHALVQVDGETVREIDVPEGPYQPVVVDGLDWKRGHHSVGVKFTNDVNEGGQDRDLHVQKASLEFMPRDEAPAAP